VSKRSGGWVRYVAQVWIHPATAACRSSRLIPASRLSAYRYCSRPSLVKQ
jgi:hypothetical protein